MSGNPDKDLYLAACKGDTMALIAAKGQGGNIDSTHSFGMTPLMVAAKYNKKPEVEQLIHWGADCTMKVTGSFDLGKTAAQLAKEAGHNDIYNIITEAEQKQIEKKKAATPAGLPGPAKVQAGLPGPAPVASAASRSAAPSAPGGIPAALPGALPPSIAAGPPAGIPAALPGALPPSIAK
eukprot:CAMPEP_0201506490 /NCGR_PEP_ID=MMETSP0161_2-20130828/421_1 /ASSEMBLY_ACC=CAM_ASM_000251 /TAXON_ID=180227 /ORGANISM="Neoparamoeba aestuarina, Strain SoJaBio B1-5/56/2" /LENGTH=179 /DNA_ID=CAMNT_0047900595 /DNA_START=111 /DNA_END=650 /DNA_ORIENTATION=-